MEPLALSKGLNARTCPLSSIKEGCLSLNMDDVQVS